MQQILQLWVPNVILLKLQNLYFYWLRVGKSLRNKGLYCWHSRLYRDWFFQLTWNLLIYLLMDLVHHIVFFVCWSRFTSLLFRWLCLLEVASKSIWPLVLSIIFFYSLILNANDLWSWLCFDLSVFTSYLIKPSFQSLSSYNFFLKSIVNWLLNVVSILTFHSRCRVRQVPQSIRLYKCVQWVIVTMQLFIIAFPLFFSCESLQNKWWKVSSFGDTSSAGIVKWRPPECLLERVRPQRYLINGDGMGRLKIWM